MDRTTAALAAKLGVKPQSILRAYCQKGSYCGLRPIKLPNRRLLWPVDAFEQLTGAAEQSTTAQAAA